MSKRRIATACLLVLSTSFLSACSRNRSAAYHDKDEAKEKDAPAYLELDLRSGLKETFEGGPWLGSDPRPVFAQLLLDIKELAELDEAKGIFINAGNASLSFNQALELSEELQAFREKKLPIHCHANGLDHGLALLFLAACDRITIVPAGSVETVGLGGQNLFFKGLLDNFGVHAQFLHVGKYKSAVESFTRDSASDEAKEALLVVLRDTRESWLKAMRSERRSDKIVNALEKGPYSAIEAKKLGIVDELLYLPEAREALKKAAGAKRRTFVGDAGEASEREVLAKLFHSLTGNRSDEVDEPHIAILPFGGSINMGGGGVNDEGIHEQSAISRIRKLRKNDAVKAVVMRIDSPGGSALASDLIWDELRQLNDAKPLIVSVGSMAASGGYYMAVAGREIFAEPTSIVGSIGVFGGKIVFGEALNKIGVRSETYAAASDEEAVARVGYLSPFDDWSPAMQERVQAQMQSTYDLFLSRVSMGRGRPVSEIEDSAQGRIWTGKQGLERGLIDKLGGLSSAIARTRELVEDGLALPVHFEEQPDMLLELLGLAEGVDEESLARAGLSSATLSQENLGRALEEARRRLEDTAVRGQYSWIQSAMPELRSYLSALRPLQSGERVVATIPWIPVIR